MELLKAYLCDLSIEDYERGFNMMSEERKSAILRLRSAKDKKRSILGEILARRGISKLCDIPEEDIQFKRTENGKPYASNTSMRFSISHSKNIVVCAIDYDEIGVDAELTRDIDLRITKFACTDKDLEYIHQDDNKEETNLRFFKLWTAKEAYIKYCGTGISYLKQLNFSDIEENCTFSRIGDYMVTVYQKK